MRLLILSDLHLQWGPFNAPDPDRYDAVVLAGDIGQGPKAVAWAQRDSTFAGKPVILVPGNHEYYGLERHRTLERMREQALGSNVHLLDRDELVLPQADGAVRFLGTTLWTDFAVTGPDIAQAMNRARWGLNDFAGAITQRDAVDRRRYRPEDALHEHRSSRAWLSQRLCDASVALATVVVTHHGPSARSIVPEYAGHELNACYVSELPEPFFGRARLWVHGHVHSSIDYLHHGTRVVANPRGYLRRDGSPENRHFEPGFVIDIGPQEGP